MARPIRTVVYVVLLLSRWYGSRPARRRRFRRRRSSATFSAAEMEETLAGLRADVAGRPPLVIVLGDSSLRWHRRSTRARP
jgi:hypothetical protein